MGGSTFNFDRILNFFPGNFTGSYQFNTPVVVQSEAGRAPRVSATSRRLPAPARRGATTHPEHQTSNGLFVQDEWRVQ